MLSSWARKDKQDLKNSIQQISNRETSRKINSIFSQQKRSRHIGGTAGMRVTEVWSAFELSSTQTFLCLYPAATWVGGHPRSPPRTTQHVPICKSSRASVFQSVQSEKSPQERKHGAYKLQHLVLEDEGSSSGKVWSTCPAPFHASGSSVLYSHHASRNSVISHYIPACAPYCAQSCTRNVPESSTKVPRSDPWVSL